MVFVQGISFCGICKYRFLHEIMWVENCIDSLPYTFLIVSKVSEELGELVKCEGETGTGMEIIQTVYRHRKLAHQTWQCCNFKIITGLVTWLIKS